MKTALDKITGLLKKYGIAHTVNPIEIWVSLKTIKNLEPKITDMLVQMKTSRYAKTALSDYLTSIKYEHQITWANFTGYTVWVKRPGIKITTSAIKSPSFSIELHPDGKFCRAFSAAFGGNFHPDKNNNKGYKISEIIIAIEHHNPNNIIALKQRTIQRYQKELQDYKDSVQTEINHINNIRTAIKEIIGDKTDQVLKTLESHGIKLTSPQFDDLPTYTNKLDIAIADLQTYEKSLEWWENE